MKIAQTLTMISLAASFCSAHAGTLPERVRKAAQERVDAGWYPTLVIAYVDGDKSEVDAFGKLDGGKAPDADTVFEIGSITKTFSATLLAEAVQSGQLKLDEPVAKLLPGFKIPSRNGKEITLLELGTQHSGLPRMPGNFKPADPANPYADYDAAKLKEFLAGYTLPRDPGASYEYSNLGFGLLGYALAEQARTNYPKLVDSKILHPLGMMTSGVALTPAMRAQLAPGHGEDGKPAANWDLDALAGAGAIRSTGADMLRYLKANMRADKTALAQAMKFAQQPRRDVRKDERIGLAWMTRTDAKGNGVVWHNGGTGGYRSFLGFSADGKRGVVVLTNIASDADDLGFAALIDDAPLRPAQKKVAVDATLIDDYVGEYKLAERFFINISRKDDQLFAQATGQGAFPLYASAKDEFFAQVAGISISFKRGADGKIDSLVLHQNGDRTAPKLKPGAEAAGTKPIALSAEVLRQYAGQYQLAPNAVFDIVAKDDGLHAQLSGQASFPVFASAKDKFFYTVVDAQLDFERDASGKVVALTLHQNGRDQRAPRIAP